MLTHDGNTAKFCRRYLQLQAMLEADEEYISLTDRREAILPALMAALDALPEAQRDAVIEYLGLCAELENRTMELACTAD